MAIIIPLENHKTGTPISGDELGKELARARTGTKIATDESHKKLSPKITTHENTNIPSSKEELPIEKLYPEQDRLAIQYATAFRLLGNVSAYANEALEFFRSGDKVKADDSVIKITRLLPELFCCRSIGDGFGAIIISLYNGLQKLDGQALNEDQLIIIAYSLKKLNAEPVMQFSVALELIEQIEESGLEIEPPEYDNLAEILVPTGETSE